MTSPSLTLFRTNVYRLSLMFGFTTLPDQVTYPCSCPAVAMVVLWGSHDRHWRVPCDGYIIGQFHWLSRMSSLLVTRHRVINWRPLCVHMVTECSIRFELGSCAAVHGSSCARFNCVGSGCTSPSLDCSWLPCLRT